MKDWFKQDLHSLRKLHRNGKCGKKDDGCIEHLRVLGRDDKHDDDDDLR